MNRIVEVVRSWLDEASVSVAQLHHRLTDEHFSGGGVPTLRKLRVLLSGQGMSWELVEAAADVCFPEEPARNAEMRLAPLRKLWQAAQSTPSPVSADALPDTARELLEAKDRTIAAYEEIDRARRAFQSSERSRLQALQVATVVFALLGQAQAKTTELQRQVDALRAASPSVPEHVSATDQRLQRAVEQEQDLRLELARAEAERATAQRVADHAARRIRGLEEEVARLRSGVGGDAETLTLSEGSLPDVRLDDQAVDDDAFDDVDRALAKVRSVLDHEHEVVQEAAGDVGWHEAGPGTSGRSMVVPGQVVASRESERVGADTRSTLSGTTENNSSSAGEENAGAVARRTDAMSMDRTPYVGAATRRIARGVDSDEILLGLCRAAVPTFADSLLVYLRDPVPVGDERPTGPFLLRLRRMGRLPQMDGVDIADRTRLPQLDDVPELAEVRPKGSMAKVLRGVRPVFGEAEVAQAALSEVFGNGFLVRPDRRVVIAPLRGRRRRAIGLAVFLRHPDREPFEQDDLLVAATLATHTALGVDKAALNGQLGNIAGELQRSMLPYSFPALGAAQVASRYLPATEEARVGGDWYEAIAQPGGKVALVIGDVMGHSMTAAAIMGQLRSSIQVLAEQGAPPAKVFWLLDKQARQLGEDRVATCLYAVYDPDLHRLSMVNAGHPPPMMLYPDGQATVFRVPPGVPIGVGGLEAVSSAAGWDVLEVDVPAGSTLLLYTNGLVQSRTLDAGSGIGRLREWVVRAGQTTATHPHALEALCDEVLGVLDRGDRDDDVALLAVQLNRAAGMTD